MKRKTIFMETTTIDVSKTAMSMTDLLAASGASQITCDYTDGKISGMRWIQRIDGRDELFAMPARVEPIMKLLSKKLNGQRLKDQAARVAWRQLFRWTEAQLAMVDVGMAKTDEVFMAYREVRPGISLYDLLSDGSRLKQLSEGSTE